MIKLTDINYVSILILPRDITDIRPPSYAKFLRGVGAIVHMNDGTTHEVQQAVCEVRRRCCIGNAVQHERARQLKEGDKVVRVVRVTVTTEVLIELNPEIDNADKARYAAEKAVTVEHGGYDLDGIGLLLPAGNSMPEHGGAVYDILSEIVETEIMSEDVS